MRVTAAIVTAAIAAAVGALPAGGSSASYRTPATHALRTAMYMADENLGPSEVGLFMRRARAAGARQVRLTLNWAGVAPAHRPPDFDPTNPNDPAYTWTTPDSQLEAARARGLEPLVTISGPPSWAGGHSVSAAQLGDFAKAAARRYSGSFQGLPRVRYWLVWNEPNLYRYLAPQYRGRRLVGVNRYRKMVNAVTAAAHGVHRDNVVVAGELAPLDTPTSPGAMKFTRGVLCVSQQGRSTCKTRVNADVWSVHPYTSGGPAHKAFGADGVSLGNVPQLQRIVRAAVRRHHLHSSRHVRVWNTEFSWDSRPPDPLGVPVQLEARWTADALYREWAAGIGVFTWFRMVDQPLRKGSFQSGLYYRGRGFKKARPKSVLRAFRFPFVAIGRSNGIYFWGRTPDSLSHPVGVYLRAGHAWKRVAVMQANASGIFYRTVAVPGVRKSSSFRAKLLGGGSDHSVSFPLNLVRDHYYPAFGK